MVLGYVIGCLLLCWFGYVLDLDVVLGVCEVNGIVVEINVNVVCFDFDWCEVLCWWEWLKFVINIDVYVFGGLCDVCYGVM